MCKTRNTGRVKINNAHEILKEIEKLLDSNGEYNLYVAKNLNNELKEIIIVPYQ